MDWLSFALGALSGGCLTPLLKKATYAALARTGKRTAIVRVACPRSLRRDGITFGLLHVRDGKDQVDDKGPLLNRTVKFSGPDIRGMLTAKVRFDRRLGFQFKCFVDHGALAIDEVKAALIGSGFTDIGKGGGPPRRVWFLTPDYGTCQTVDGITNNFSYPV